MRVLVVCYQIERGKGSEAGSGYNFLVNLRLLGHRITLVTRPNNAEPLRVDPALAGVTIVGHDPPHWLTRRKRGSRGVLPFYYAWQIGAGRLALRLHRQERFDVVHQYNFHTDWAPHFLRLDDARVVWGPICHQPVVPPSYLQLERRRGLVREASKGLAKRFFWHLDPNLRRAIRASDVILFANRDVPDVYARSGKVRFQTFGGALPDQTAPDEPAGDPLRLLHVGRAVSIKGGAVALDAVAEATARGAEVTLTVVGDGPLRAGLEKKARASGLSERVRFVPWLDRDALRHEYARAHAFLYPSLGNQDGVVAEALAAALPVIGVSGSGTEIMAGTSGLWARRGPYRRLVEELADAIVLLAAEARDDVPALRRRRSAARARAEAVSWHSTARQVAESYRPS